MPRENGYVSPLLSNLSQDYSRKVREGLIGSLLLPRVLVDKPSGEYAVFNAETAYKVPDTTMAGERSQAREFNASGKPERFSCVPHGLKSFIDSGNLEFTDGPFKTWEKNKVELLTSKLELSQEKRIADTILRLPNRSVAMAGTGTTKGKKWAVTGASTGGNPHGDILDAIAQCFFRPNIMVIPESVFDAIEYHPVLIAKLGESNMIKKVDETTLAKLFRIDRVVIAKGKADFGKRNDKSEVTLTGIWGNNVILAYTSDVWDEPCVGKTVSVRYQAADNNGYIVRTWDEEDGGLLGGEYVQVGHDVAELIQAKDLVYTIKDVL